MPEGIHYFTKTSAPPKPPAGKVALYSKSDGLLYWKDDTNTERAVNFTSADASWPIGSIFMNITSTNPATLLGVGTWTRFGSGRMLVSQDSGDPDFDVAEETGGAKTHVQSVGELAQHSHTQDAHTHTQNAHTHTQDAHNHTQDAHTHTDSGHAHNQATTTIITGAGAGPLDTSFSRSTGGVTQTSNAVISSTVATNQAATATNQNTTATNQTTTATNQNTGSSTAMNIMNPYIVVYMWKRTL